MVDIPVEAKVIFYQLDLAIYPLQTIEETLSHCYEQCKR